MMAEPRGRTALITGAGSGIGRCVAQVFAARGATGLVLFDLDEAGLAETVASLSSSPTEPAAGDVEVLTRVVDVSDPDQLVSGFGAAIERFTTLDYVINNAATMTLGDGFPSVSFERVQQVLDLNVGAVVHGMKLAFEHMTTTGGGSIVSTASGAGKVGLPSDPLYAATKSAVLMITRSAAAEFAAAGVRINAVCPSLVDTPMLASTEVGRAALAAPSQSMPILQPVTIAEAIVDIATDPSAAGETPSVR